MIKIGIVGPEEPRWKPKQIPRAKDAIYDIFYGLPIEVLGNRVGGNYEIAKLWTEGREREITLVSGGCKKGGSDIWAEDVADELGIKKEIYPPEVNQWPDKIGCPNNPNHRIACSEGCNHSAVSHIPREGELWDCLDEEASWEKQVVLKRYKGYRSRNIQIAVAFDLGYCVVPSDLNLYCKHHKTFGHPSNGGCWTILHGNEKLGKEVHLIVV